MIAVITLVVRQSSSPIGRLHQQRQLRHRSPSAPETRGSKIRGCHHFRCSGYQRPVMWQQHTPRNFLATAGRVSVPSSISGTDLVILSQRTAKPSEDSSSRSKNTAGQISSEQGRDSRLRHTRRAGDKEHKYKQEATLLEMAISQKFHKGAEQEMGSECAQKGRK